MLRIEDIDRTRCRPEFDAALVEDLIWLGLDWDGPIRRQSNHFSEYAAAVARLQSMGVLYPCFCSRKDIAAAGAAPQGPDGPLYPGTCRTLSSEEASSRQSAGASYALRLDVAKARALVGDIWFDDEGFGRVTAEPERLGDVVLARRDIPCSYHLCVTLDDALQGVTLVTRGEDLRPATHIHRMLQALLDLDVPRYAHHKLLKDNNGVRLAKRDGATSLRTLREAGLVPADIRAMTGYVDDVPAHPSPSPIHPH